MKTKTVEIQYCEDCPHCRYDKYIEMYCKKTGRKTGVIAIPDWCPLPDSHAPELLEVLEKIVLKTPAYGALWAGSEEIMEARKLIKKAREGRRKMKKCDLDRLYIPDECFPNPQTVEELSRIISSEPKLREALNRIVNCLETIKANSIEMEKGMDWFDWAFINQEIAHSKKVLKGDAE